MSTSRRRISPLLAMAATASLLIVGLVAPSSAVSDVSAVDAPVATASNEDTNSDAARPDDLPEIGEVFDPGDVSTDDVCAEDWCTHSYSGWGPDDKDGKYAAARLSNAYFSLEYYYVFFDPQGEQLTLWDRFSDGHQARADVIVSVPFTKVVLDRDSHLYSSYNRVFNLGTPDGSGDIREKLNVSIRVCRGTKGPCSGWVTGRA